MLIKFYAKQCICSDNYIKKKLIVKINKQFFLFVGNRDKTILKILSFQITYFMKNQFFKESYKF